MYPIRQISSRASQKDSPSVHSLIIFEKNLVTKVSSARNRDKNAYRNG